MKLKRTNKKALPEGRRERGEMMKEKTTLTNEISLDVALAGIKEKTDMLNHAIDLLREAERVVSEANRISVSVELATTHADCEAQSSCS
jgi:hypothetical protein